MNIPNHTTSHLHRNPNKKVHTTDLHMHTHTCITTLIWSSSNSREFRWASDAIESVMSLKTFLLMFVFMPTIFSEAYILVIPRSAAILLT